MPPLERQAISVSLLRQGEAGEAALEMVAPVWQDLLPQPEEAFHRHHQR